MHPPEKGDGRLPQRRIGAFLITEGYITEEQLEEALEIQKTDGRNLGRILVSSGHMTQDELARALSLRLSVEYVDLRETEVDPEVLGIINEDVLLQHKAVPLWVDKGRLVVAMTDPNDIYARSDLSISAGYPVTPVIAAEDTLESLQAHLFAGEGRSVRGGAYELAEALEAFRDAHEADGFADEEAGVAGNGRDEWVEPGSQPEVDLGEPVVAESAAENGRGGRPASEEPPSQEKRRGAGGLRGKKIGDILMAEGKISEEQLRQALELQRNDPRDLGKILLSLGYVVPDDLARALARRLKLDFVVISELSEDEVDPSALSMIGEDALRKYMVLPLRFEGEKLVVAMSDPNDIFALEDLKIITKRSIAPVVATEEDLRGALDHLYGDENLYPETAVDEEAATEEEAEPLPPEEPEDRNGAVEEDEAVEAEVEEDEAADGWAVVDRIFEDDGGGAGKESGGGSGGGALVPIEQPKSRKVAVGGGRIGDILVAHGRITEEQLEQALMLQKDDPREVGKILLSLGYIEKADLARALAQRLRLGYVELTEREVDRGAVSLVEQKVLRRHGVMPLRLENNRLVVAMSDPTNIYALEDLMMLSGYPVTPVVALAEEIQRVHNQIFAVSDEVSEFLEDARTESVVEDQGDLDLGIETSPDEAPIIRLVSAILQQAVGDGASDIHIEPQARQLAVRMRVDGVLREAMSIPPKLQSGVIARLKVIANLDIAERRLPQDGRFSVKLGGKKIDLRVASLPTVHGEKIVLRLLDTSNAEVQLTALGFPPEVYKKYEEIFRRPYGAILVTGPTGSGKSTTLYATLNELNSPDKNIITVEDPVEYRMRGINQIQTNPRAGLTFASSLKSILRADPDVVMIGEIRDHETAQIAVEAALTGHLVLSTLHTNDAPGAVNRLTDMDVEPFLTSSAVDCVIAQRLARRLCDRCKEPVEMEEEILAGIRFPFELAPSELGFHKAVGCNWCGGSGYRGRIGLYELMVVDEEVKDMILRRASTGEIGRAAEEAGMIRLRDDGLLKAAAGTTTIEEILRTVI